MATLSDGTKLFKPFMPSLLHYASVKTAAQLYKEFGHEAMEEAFSEIQQGDSGTGETSSGEIRRAKESLLYIPAHLRGTVMKAVRGTHRVVQDWTWSYSSLFGYDEIEGDFQFRSDGSLDAVKTARKLVGNEELGIRSRFSLACAYCFADSAQALWAEMEKIDGSTESFETRDDDVVSLWVGWLRERPRLTSAQSFIQSLRTLIPRSPGFFDISVCAVVPRLSVISPLLRPGDLSSYFPSSSDYDKLDDLLSYLYTIPKEGEEQVLRDPWIVYLVLLLHLQWPLQTLFLEKAAKLWNSMDEFHSAYLLSNILYLKEVRKDFDYSDLFERLRYMSPLELRRSWESLPNLKLEIDSYFEKKMRKKNY